MELWDYYIHKHPVILHDKLQRDPTKLWPSYLNTLQLLRKDMNTGTSTTLTAEIH